MNRCSRIEREAQEHLILDAQACFSDESQGRSKPASHDPYRCCFQRDRDRILHSKAFRRLSHKTQVFLAPEGDHYRTRLTHTLEVSQISRTVARALGLNEDLAEAIAMGHDLGHTPFGHTGEDALSHCIGKRLGLKVKDGPGCVVGYGGLSYFKHNEQSLRVVDYIERDGAGLDLSYEVRDGILCHTGAKKACTLEGQVVALCDRIAYVNHDLDDAIRARIVSESDLPQKACSLLGISPSDRISSLVWNLIEYSSSNSVLSLDDAHAEALKELRSFLFQYVYTSIPAQEESCKAFALVCSLFDYYVEHVDEIPELCRNVAEEHPLSICPEDVCCTAACDHVAGMSDRFAINDFRRLFEPKSWHSLEKEI